MINAIYPYNPGSESARLLAEALDVPRIKHRGSRFRGTPAQTVLNWGAGELPPHVARCRILNQVHRVNMARCKRRTFETIAHRNPDVRIPEFTTSPQVARGWLVDGDVCIRHTTTGHEGNGLKIVNMGDLEAFDRERVAPLYTKYIKKRDEYRVHVIGETTYTQKKIRKRDAEGGRQVRNTANGYVFTSNTGEVNPDVVAQALAATRAIGLDFAAVDVVWNRHHQQAWVLELNTAPGIEGRTVEVYAEALRRLVG